MTLGLRRDCCARTPEKRIQHRRNPDDTDACLASEKAQFSWQRTSATYLYACHRTAREKRAMPSSIDQKESQKTETLAQRARQNTVAVDQTKTVGGSDPQYDIYHFGFSICSNKVRAVLFELGLRWLSLELDPAKHQNYRPDYVRLRLASDAASGGQFATGWEGGSSVEESGFDALVVPTVFDRENACVVADSLSICRYLAAQHRDLIDLVPEVLLPEIERQLEAVDQTPHVALLYGPNPDGTDGRAFIFRQVFKGEHLKKVAAAEAEASKVAGEDQRLDAAYAAKIAKERAGSAFVADREKMRGALDKTRDLLAQLDKDIEGSSGPWICGSAFTLADLFWGVSLFRLEYLGYGWLWRNGSNHKALQEYSDRTISRPSVLEAVAGWPSHPWSRPVAKWMRKPSLKDRVMGLGS
ncbi:MAG: glutathione S-transferase [Pseudomonadota bacterium]